MIVIWYWLRCWVAALLGGCAVGWLRCWVAALLGGCAVGWLRCWKPSYVL
jgi:hypothetical protein